LWVATKVLKLFFGKGFEELVPSTQLSVLKEKGAKLSSRSRGNALDDFISLQCLPTLGIVSMEPEADVTSILLLTDFTQGLTR